MRRGMNGGLINNDGVFVGVNLGADFVSEHEWGIKRIASDYGLRKEEKAGLLGTKTKPVLGIEARRVQAVPKTLKYAEHGEYTYLVSPRAYSFNEDRENTKKDLDQMVQAWSDDEFTGAWDEGSFGVRVKGEDARAYLAELYAAFTDNDVIITFVQEGSGFGNSGLAFLIASRLPKEYVDGQLEADLDRIALLEASEATGIADRVKAAGLEYFALSPKWAKEIKSTRDGEIKTDYDVIYWLNPRGQKKHNFGWFTVEQLDQWTKGEGPCIMKPDEAA